MLSNRHHLAEAYFQGRFSYPETNISSIEKQRFDAVHDQFSFKYDDFYHAYFKAYGKAVEPNKALIRIAFTLFLETYHHLPKAYKNCAISSGTTAHIDAVTRNHHTTDRLSRVVGSEWHGKTIKDNSQRSLERIERIKDLYSEVFFIAPVMYEGSTRAFSKGFGRQLTSLPFQAEEYMAFWNMVIDQCEAFVLDDMRLDMPSIEIVEREISLAKTWSTDLRIKPLLQTSNWADSRNSIYEAARAVYIKFGLHPLRPDARMDIRIYDQESHRLYPSRLIDIVKPMVQNILRWAPQGIATDSACTTVARLFDLHRMRTDRVYNSLQTAPLELDRIDPSFAHPTLAEQKEFNLLMQAFEPFLLKYVPHLINTNGLPAVYTDAQMKHDIRPSDVGEKSLRWQRENIPLQSVLGLWPLTIPTKFEHRRPCKIQPISTGLYRPQRRQHDFEQQPFLVPDTEVWPDKPFDQLDPMFQQLAKAHIGVLEIVVQNSDKPEYRGIRYDLKRGEYALSVASSTGLADLSLLSGALGKAFDLTVKQPTLIDAKQQLEKSRILSVKHGKEKVVPVFGAPIIAVLNDTIRRERHHFPGPGPTAPPSDYRLALDMEMLRRNYTSYQFQKNWETSEDGARMMMMATKMELDHVQRSAGNNTELKVLDENGNVIPFAERVRSLYLYLSILKQDIRIKRAVEERNSDVVEAYGVRHISLTLARLLEIYDCFKDQDYNNERFEVRRVRALPEFTKDMDTIRLYKDDAQKHIEQEWCWLWPESDLEGLPANYRNAWLAQNGRQGQLSGAQPDYAQGIKNRFGPA